MNLRQFGLLMAAFGSIAQTSSLFAASKVDAVRLDYIALDDSVKCNREFFGSSERIVNTIFMAPMVMPGSNPDGKRSYSFIPKGPGKWELYIRLIFPDSERAGRLSGASSQTGDLNECNLDRVRASLNRHIRDPRLHISKVAKIPLTSAELEIPGFDGKVARVYNIEGEKKDGRVNDGGVDILSYKGINALTLNMEVTDREKDSFYAQIVDEEGLPLRIRLIFEAETRDGSATARMDRTAVQGAFRMAVGGKAVLTAAEAQVGFQKAVTEDKISITSTMSKSAAANRAIEDVIKSALAKMNSALEKKIDAQAKAKAGDDGKVTLGVALEIIDSAVSAGIDYNNIVKLEAKMQVERRLRVTSLRDPNIHEVKVHADWSSPSFGTYMKAGMAMKIVAAHWRINKITYDDKKSILLTTSDLESELQPSDLSILTNENYEIANRTINGFTFAVATLKPHYSWSFAGLTGPSPEYRFRKVNVESVHTPIRSGQIEGTREAMAELPVGLAFSNFNANRAVSFKSLLALPKEHPYIDVTFDDVSGAMTVTAKQDLGIVHFRELMSEANPEDVVYGPDPQDLVVYQVERRFNGKSEVAEKHSVKPDPRSIIQQKVITFHVTSSLAAEAKPQ